MASVGIVWTQQNVDFYGRDSAEERVVLPRLGVREALVRARIASLPVHADHVDRDRNNLATLILPNVGALSDAQCAAIRRFVEGGGGLVASGETSCYDEWGEPRAEPGLAELFGVEATSVHHGSSRPADPSWETWGQHSYLRLAPERRPDSYGPGLADEPPGLDARHPVLAGFEHTDLLPFGGRLEVVRARSATSAPLTFVPPFPIYPPETAWMRQPTSALPALVLNEPANGGRVAYLAADVDRCFGRDYFPDHAVLLANLVRWTARDRIPLQVEGPGLIDCHPYKQAGRYILHLVNLTNPGTWRPPLHELVPVGPMRVRVLLDDDVVGCRAQLLVANCAAALSLEGGWAHVEVPTILDHEVVVIS